MSAPTSCCSPCSTSPTVVNVPGVQGEAGQNGTNGTDGKNAFTVTTANFVIPAVGDPVSNPDGFIYVADTSWMAVGQTIIISDGTDWGTFTVTSIPNSLKITAVFLGHTGDAAPAATIDSGAQVSPAGTQPAIPSPTTIANGGTGSATATAARAALGVGGEPLTVYAAGTAYQLTNTQALLNFGTTDPSLVITSPGVWLILARARIDYTAATFAAVRTVTLKLRRTNNTAADIPASPTSWLTDIITTLTYTMGVIGLQPIIYTTTNSDDILQLWGAIDVVPSAGSIDATEASIVAIKLYDQTV